MSLTSFAVVAASWVLSIALFVTTVALLGARIRGGGILRFFGILLTCVSLILSIALTVNRPMGYVQTVSDAVDILKDPPKSDLKASEVGAPPKPTTPTEMGPTTPLPAMLAGVKPSSPEYARWTAQWTPDSDGSKVTKWTGPTSLVTAKIRIWTPRGYSPTDKKTYNVIEFLHGYPGSPDGVMGALNAATEFQRLIDEGVIPPTIFVIPEANVDPGPPSCADVPGKAQIQKWLSFDIPKMLRTQFPNVGSQRSQWFITGISSGAYCAGRSYFVHPEVWGMAGVLSGYDYPELGPLGQGTRELAEANTLSKMAAQPRHYPAWIYVSGAVPDPDSIVVGQNLVAAASHKGDRVYAHLLATGGHNWSQWKAEMPVMLKWWSEQLKDPAITKAPAVNNQMEKQTVKAKVKKTVEPKVLSLMGWGTIGVSGFLTFLAFLMCMVLGPMMGHDFSTARHRHAHERKPGAGSIITRAGMLFLTVVLAITTVLLVINRLGTFYTSLDEVLKVIGTALG
ncbi:MAG: alpha/beta hydrolase-fold protein [Actinomycetaceae bacterium]|nr:alpha/beta hydrolase-fold protein [Actinomycetaceae bacterium]MDU0970709.1 alpha/beta hydrolase-fold protein [Actinomycetaceae bacterium]